MTPEDEVEFGHMWDGSRGWVLHRHFHQLVAVSIVFAGAGPSLTEMVALRRLLPHWGSLRPGEVKRRLAGADSLVLEPLPPPEAERVAGLARQLGLSPRSSGASYVSYLPVDKETQMVTIIEDDALAAQVHERMLLAGVPVVEG